VGRRSQVEFQTGKDAQKRLSRIGGMVIFQLEEKTLGLILGKRGREGYQRKRIDKNWGSEKLEKDAFFLLPSEKNSRHEGENRIVLRLKGQTCITFIVGGGREFGRTRQSHHRKPQRGVGQGGGKKTHFQIGDVKGENHLVDGDSKRVP